MAKDLSLKILINAQDNTGNAFGKTKQGIASINEQLAGLKTRMTGLLGLSVGDVLFGKAADLIKTADSYKTLEARLKLVSDNTKEFATAQSALFDVAQRSRSSLEGTYTLYGKLETAIKSMGGTQQQSLQITETLNQAIALTSQGMEQDKDVVLQFSQALASGVLRGDEFNSVMEASPGLAQALADGLGVTTGQLRGMAEAGQLTSDKLIDALGKVAPSIAEKFKQLPLTVGQAMTQLNNAFTVYIGNADKASGSSAKLAGVISGIADNFNTIATAVLTVAEVYGVKLVLGLSASTKAFIENALAVRQKALADQQAAAAALIRLQWEAKQAEVTAQNSVLLIREAQLQRALAVTDEQRTATLIALNAAYAKNQTAVAAAIAKNAQLQASTNLSAVAVGKMEKAFAALNLVFGAWIAFDVGQTIGDWLRRFESVRVAGSYLAEAFVILQARMESFGKSGQSFATISQQIKDIHAQFEEIRRGETATAKSASDAEQAHAASVEQANTKMQASLKATETAYQEFFATVDALYQQEVEKINQREQQQTLDLEKSVADEQERARLITDIILKANEERIRLATNLADEKNRIIDAMYNKEIEKARSNGLSVAGIEQALFAKKIEILKALETATKTAIDKMIADEQRHIQAAQDAAEARKNLAISTEEAILAFLRESMDEQQKVRSFGNEQETLQSDLRKAQAAGDFEEQQRISKRLMELAFERGHTERQIAEENGDAVVGANNRAVESYRTAANAAQSALEGVRNAEQGAADKAHAAAEEASKSLQNVQDRIGELQRRLGQNTESKHVVTSNYAEVLKEILSLNGQNTESTHTVKTEQARQNGGPILRLNSGGKLSGYGGGDTVPAMLEPGEFVVRKEAVDKYGAGLFAKLNAMNVNVGDVVKRRFGGIIPGFAVGGSVDSNVVDLEKERRKLRLTASQAEIAKWEAGKEQLKGEIDAIKKKIAGLASQSVVQGTSFGMDMIHPTSSDVTLNMLLKEASKAAFGRGGVAGYLDNATNVIRLLVLKLHKAKKTFEDLPIGWNGPKLTYDTSTGNQRLNIKFATGGGVPGVGNTDTVPAMLTPGEWVINKASVAKYGNAFMDAVNRGTLPQGFNSGGQVGASPGGNIVVQFKAPNGQSAQSQFGSQSDVNQFLEVIRLSGGVTK